MRVILASASPRRRELFENLGIEFEVVTSDAEESSVPGETPAEAVCRLSGEKAEAVCREVNDRSAIIVGADTVVAIDGQILGKPKDERDAYRMLSMLSGREHIVYTGYTLLRASDGRRFTGYDSTRVVFRSLTDDEIRRYIMTGEPMDKAGAYGIQRYGSLLVNKISGDYFNIVGLPVCSIGLALRDEFGLELIV